MANMKRSKKIQRLQQIQGIATEPVKTTEKKDPAPKANSEFTDELSDSIDKFELWFIENGKIILAVCVLILILVAAFYTVKYVVNSKAAADTELYANASTAEQLEKALKARPNAPEATAAEMSLAADYAEKKQYDKALTLYTEISKKTADEYVSRKAALNAAYINEINNKKAEALSVYVRLADDFKTPTALRAEAAYAAGRLYASAKNYASARKYLSMFTASSMNQEGAQWAAFSRAILNRLPAQEVKPAAKPVTIPAAKPTAKPTAKPVAKPTAKPAAK